MADTPEYPDTNCCLFIDPRGRLWLMWPTILANTWESALMKYRISNDYFGDGAPNWTANEVMHVTPGPEFGTAITNFARHAEATLDKSSPGAEDGQRLDAWLASVRAQAANKLTRRLGWFTRESSGYTLLGARPPRVQRTLQPADCSRTGEYSWCVPRY